MKQILNKSLMLKITLIFSSLIMTACAASEKATEGKGSAGGTEQVKAGNDDNKSTAKNKSDEAKKQAEKQVLWDFRKSDFSKSQEISKAETDAVLKYLLETDSWDKDLGITNRLQGSFTKPNAKETLYYVSGCKVDGEFVSNSTCGHAGWDSDAWIAVFDGTTPILKINQALGSLIQAITDVNGDGKNEFLSFGGYAQSGQQTSGVSIGQISAGKYESIKGFKGYADNCAWGATLADDKKMAKAASISYIPMTDGKMPEFTEEYFGASCKDEEVDNSTWKKITKKEFDGFFESLS